MEDLVGLNERTKILKQELANKTRASNRKSAIIWLVVLSSIVFLWLLLPGDSIIFLIILGLIGLVFGRSTDYDSWLHEE
jgi:hypothetical protein